MTIKGQFYCFLFLLLYPSILLAQRLDTAVISVRSAGAKGDGITDDSKALQQALQQAQIKKIRTVLLPAGTYLISQTLQTVIPGTRVIFEKGAKLKLANNTQGGILITNDNCIIENAVIEGNGTPATDFYKGYGIMLAGVSGCTVKNCWLSGISGCNVFLIRSRQKGCTDCVITGNTVRNPAFVSAKGLDASAIMVGYSGTGYFHRNNTISSNDIDGAQVLGHGIAVMAHGSDNKIVNNTVRNCLRYGIISYETSYEDSTLTATSIIGNTISNIGAKDGTTTNMGMGIYIMKTHYAVIKGNKIDHVLENADRTETLGRGAIAINGAVGCTITDNRISNSGRYGIVCIYGFNTVISNNKIMNVVESGIYLRNTSGNVIGNNEFRGITRLAIRGQFGNTGKPAYAPQGFLRKFRNVQTGEGIRIIGNKFYGASKDVINLAGEDEEASPGFNNPLKGVEIRDNELIGINQPIDGFIKVSNVAPGGISIKRNRNN